MSLRARMTFSSAASWASRRSTRRSRVSSMLVRSGICALTPSVSGPPLGGALSKFELTVVDVRHLGEPLAQGIEPDDMGIHLAEAHGHGIHPLLQLLAQARQSAVFPGPPRRPSGPNSRCRGLAPLRSPSFMPSAKAVPSMPSTSAPMTPRATGCARLSCLALPAACENNMMFMPSAPEPCATTTPSARVPVRTIRAWTGRKPPCSFC